MLNAGHAIVPALFAVPQFVMQVEALHFLSAYVTTLTSSSSQLPKRRIWRETNCSARTMNKSVDVSVNPAKQMGTSELVHEVRARA